MRNTVATKKLFFIGILFVTIAISFLFVMYFRFDSEVRDVYISKDGKTTAEIVLSNRFSFSHPIEVTLLIVRPNSRICYTLGVLEQLEDIDESGFRFLSVDDNKIVIYNRDGLPEEITLGSWSRVHMR
jgi:hypothetical protein